MATIDLGGVKIRFARNYVYATPKGPIDVSWTVMIGLATPSVRFFPFAWNVFALEKRQASRMSFSVFRLGVADDDGEPSE